VAQQANTAQASVEAIHREVALPVDEILNDAVHVMEAYIGHDASVLERLQRILRNARDIKQLIHKVGQEMAPAEAVPACAQIEARPALRNRRVLVVDDDESVRIAAHNLLDRFSCIVETAHAGDEAFYMVRNADHETLYDVVISAIKLPDMSGYQLLMKLRELPDAVPLVLMTGFGYDPGHTIVKARQAGLPANAILYKPFRLDQLLETVEGTIEANQKQVPQA
jgi:CheY-like chemotaxis protein